MTSASHKSAAIAAEIILHLARLSHGEGSARGLTAAQWATLRYFARANSASRTVLAFADYHVTTRGTASQTIKNLIASGLLVRIPSQSDGRSAQIDLTKDGQALVEEDPFSDLVEAIADLPPASLADVSTALEQVMGRITDDRQRRRFGTCPDCGHLGPCLDPEEDGATKICRLTGRPLAESELDDLCINFKPQT